MELRERAPLLHQVDELLAGIRVQTRDQVLRGGRARAYQTLPPFPDGHAEDPDGRAARGQPPSSRRSER